MPLKLYIHEIFGVLFIPVLGSWVCSGATLQALLESHDDIASKNYDAIPEAFPMFAPPPQEMLLNPNASDAIRMVGIRKNADEPLVRFLFRCTLYREGIKCIFIACLMLNVLWSLLSPRILQWMSHYSYYYPISHAECPLVITTTPYLMLNVPLSLLLPHFSNWMSHGCYYYPMSDVECPLVITTTPCWMSHDCYYYPMSDVECPLVITTTPCIMLNVTWLLLLPHVWCWMTHDCYYYPMSDVECPMITGYHCTQGDQARRRWRISGHCPYSHW